ncbi:hypothetical protein [Microvirga sp. VF16]|uniref:hypothetical protein n=1 Tax=Microvirga sp. VF16 TaxID=2807101 RepID=UPI00193E9343|nr:hypothetical protein [Microvirga sp. VF16]QRM32541.1 hypothetical protein JO965_31120 [Microvirga sp. VF16]
MQQRQRAYIVHRTVGRLRIKVPGQRHNAQFFQNLRRQLIDHAEIGEIEVNPRTASVLIKHRAGFDLGVLRNPFLELDFDGDTAQLRARPAAERHVARLDTFIQRLTGGEVDLAAFLVKIAVAVVTRQPPLQLLAWFAEALLRAFIKSKTASIPRLPVPKEPEGLLAAA